MMFEGRRGYTGEFIFVSGGPAPSVGEADYDRNGSSSTFPMISMFRVLIGYPIERGGCCGY